LGGAKKWLQCKGGTKKNDQCGWGKIIKNIVIKIIISSTLDSVIYLAHGIYIVITNQNSEISVVNKSGVKKKNF
jgi:hypothetical protein